MILNFVDLDVTTPYNCQVSAYLTPTFSHLPSDWPRSEGVDHFRIGKRAHQ